MSCGRVSYPLVAPPDTTSIIRTYNLMPSLTPLLLSIPFFRARGYKEPRYVSKIKADLTLFFRLIAGFAWQNKRKHGFNGFYEYSGMRGTVHPVQVDTYRKNCVK